MKQNLYRLQVVVLLCGMILFSQCASNKTAVNNSRQSATASTVRVKKKSKKEIKADKVLSTARSYLGTPYKWGGLNRKGMDCSGFVFMSFSAADIVLPRMVKDQAQVGSEVDMFSVKKGDLLIFRINTGKNGKFWHAGIVSDVKDADNIMFLHASSSRGVVESNLMSPYYQRWFRKAKRIL